MRYSLWMDEVGCAKVASANVEVVFSGAGRISTKSHCLDSQLLSDHAFLRYNYKHITVKVKCCVFVEAYAKKCTKMQGSRGSRQMSACL